MMNGMERVRSCLRFEPVDRVPLEYHPCLRGLYEHGDALRSMIKALPGDFEDFSDVEVPPPRPQDLTPGGGYHSLEVDEWGVEWERCIYLMAGHPKTYPLEDLSRLVGYRFPANTCDDPSRVAALAKRVEETKRKGGYVKLGWINLLEKLHALCPFETVLMELYDDSGEINDLADKLVEYQAREIQTLLDAGANGIQLADDFGTNSAMLISPECWRQFFKPRYQKLIKPIRDAGADVFFHCCGYAPDILPDLREIGVDAVWPQLSVYDIDWLAGALRDIGLACAIHIDRAGVMTRGTQDDVSRAVDAAVRAFNPMEGGSWFYVETDNDFPLENIRRLLSEIEKYRIRRDVP